MIKLKPIILFVFFIILPHNLWCNDNKELPKSFIRFTGFYFTFMKTKISDVPLTADFNVWSGSEMTTKSSDSCPAFAVGVSIPAGEFLYAGIEFEFLRPTFSDERINKRNVYLYNFFVDFGLFPSNNFPLVIYGSFGGGLFHQSGFKDDWLSEHLEENEGPLIYGIGIKFSPIKNLILKFDSKKLVKTSTYGEFEGGEEWTYAETRSRSMGVKTSFGISYIVGSKVGFFPWK